MVCNRFERSTFPSLRLCRRYLTDPLGSGKSWTRIHPTAGWHSVLPASQSRTPNSELYGLLAWKTRRRCEVSTFHIVDPMADLGALSTPVAPQFRAGSWETWKEWCKSHTICLSMLRRALLRERPRITRKTVSSLTTFGNGWGQFASK
jgi:hypothetical protein